MFCLDLGQLSNGGDTLELYSDEEDNANIYGSAGQHDRPGRYQQNQNVPSALLNTTR